MVAAKYCPDYVELLAKEKEVRAFIIISAGFGEETKAGAVLEQKILDICQQYGAALIGPNCIGLLNRQHHSVFTLPIPQLNPQGTLKKGRNILRGAIINGPGMSDFCVRFIDEKGNPVKNYSINAQ